MLWPRMLICCPVCRLCRHGNPEILTTAPLLAFQEVRPYWYFSSLPASNQARGQRNVLLHFALQPCAGKTRPRVPFILWYCPRFQLLSCNFPDFFFFFFRNSVHSFCLLRSRLCAISSPTSATFSRAWSDKMVSAIC